MRNSNHLIFLLFWISLCNIGLAEKGQTSVFSGVVDISSGTLVSVFQKATGPEKMLGKCFVGEGGVFSLKTDVLVTSPLFTGLFYTDNMREAIMPAVSFRGQLSCDHPVDYSATTITLSGLAARAGLYKVVGGTSFHPNQDGSFLKRIAYDSALRYNAGFEVLTPEGYGGYFQDLRMWCEGKVEDKDYGREKINLSKLAYGKIRMLDREGVPMVDHSVEYFKSTSWGGRRSEFGAFYGLGKTDDEGVLVLSNFWPEKTTMIIQGKKHEERLMITLPEPYPVNLEKRFNTHVHRVYAGQVLDIHKKPIPDVMVFMRVPRMDDSPLHYHVATKTNVDGQFSITGLPFIPQGIRFYHPAYGIASLGSYGKGDDPPIVETDTNVILTSDKNSGSTGVNIGNVKYETIISKDIASEYSGNKIKVLFEKIMDSSPPHKVYELDSQH